MSEKKATLRKTALLLDTSRNREMLFAAVTHLDEALLALNMKKPPLCLLLTWRPIIL
jgi:hypothetical protein